MYKKFETLSEEKRMRILNAAYGEFANKQFKEASTDEITKNEEISKGALFQYFGAKKQLYFYMYDHGYEILSNELYGQAELNNPDLLERLKSIFSIKMNLYFKYPTLFSFLLFSYKMENDKEIKTMMDNDYAAKYTQAIGKVYTGIDYSKFRDDLNKSHIISIINWTIDGYSNAEAANLKPNDLTDEKYRTWLKEIDEYMDILKKAFYKEENQHGKCN